MSKITRIYNAAERATLNRYFVNRYAHGHVKKDKVTQNIDSQLYKVLVEESGPSTSNPIKMLKSWKRAFDQSLAVIKTEDSLNSLFREPSMLSKIISSIFKR